MAWSVGDLAECINDQWGNYPRGLNERPPVLGEIRRVTSIRFYRPRFKQKSYLVFACPLQSYFAGNFRKILHIHEPAEASFEALIRRTIKAPITA